MPQSSAIQPKELETCRQLLCKLGTTVRNTIQKTWEMGTENEALSEIAEEKEEDVIYKIDRISEATILNWLKKNWPDNMPLELVMEGLDSGKSVTYPAGLSVEATKFKCIIDPIDGTRMIMYDKRSAWSLAAIAPQRGKNTTLADILVAVMTELPTSKQGRADQFSIIRGMGLPGLHTTGTERISGITEAITIHPSRATDFHHGFASLAKFFPAGRILTSSIEEKLWKKLTPPDDMGTPLIFDDQYLASGGQIAELLYGHDRMSGDLRPVIFRATGISQNPTCHPYDICTALILEELGGVVCDLAGNPLKAPLDTTSPVTWIGYANITLANLAHPILQEVVKEVLSNPFKYSEFS